MAGVSSQLPSPLLGLEEPTDAHLSSLRAEQMRRVHTVMEVGRVDEPAARAALDTHAWNLEGAIMQCVMGGVGVGVADPSPRGSHWASLASHSAVDVEVGDLFGGDGGAENPLPGGSPTGGGCAEEGEGGRKEQRQQRQAGHPHASLPSPPQSGLDAMALSHPHSLFGNTPQDPPLAGSSCLRPPTAPPAKAPTAPPAALRSPPARAIVPRAPPGVPSGGGFSLRGVSGFNPVPPAPPAPASVLQKGGVDVQQMHELFPLLCLETVTEVVERLEGHEHKIVEELLWRNQDEEDEYPGDGPEEVFLNVYNLAPERSLDKFGMGVFHSGVEVYGREWSFGGASSPDVDMGMSGVFWVHPTTAMPCVFKQISLGTTRLSHREVWKRAVVPTQQKWPVKEYHLVHRNCNHFSTHLTKLLGVKQPPSWVNRAARWGEAVVPSAVIRYLLKEPGASSSSSSSSSSSASSSFSSSSKAPSTARVRKSSSFFSSSSRSISSKKRSKDDADIASS